jgi:methanethiol S-methyltransferase
LRDRVLAFMTYAVGGGALLLFFACFGFRPPGPTFVDLHLSPGPALLLDAALSLAFFLQHSLMVRAPVRSRMARLVPAHALGAAYSVASGLALAAVVVLWQRAGSPLAAASGPAWWIGPAVAALALAAFAWGARSLRRFDPFGAHAILDHLRDRPPRPSSLSIHGPYRWVRHPLYLSTLVVIWSSPVLTADRLLFDLLWTAWIVVGTALEERDLVAELGEPYRAYRRRVPMLLPWRRPCQPTG